MSSFLFPGERPSKQLEDENLTYHFEAESQVSAHRHPVSTTTQLLLALSIHSVCNEKSRTSGCTEPRDSAAVPCWTPVARGR